MTGKARKWKEKGLSWHPKNYRPIRKNKKVAWLKTADKKILIQDLWKQICKLFETNLGNIFSNLVPLISGNVLASLKSLKFCQNFILKFLKMYGKIKTNFSAKIFRKIAQPFNENFDCSFWRPSIFLHFRAIPVNETNFNR